MFGTDDYPISVAETEPYLRDVKRLLTDDERQTLIEHLALNPEAGDVIPGTGGARKIRWSLPGMGKRRGVRVIYYFRDLNMPLYLLAAYPKGKKVDLTADERNEMRQLIELLVKAYSQRWLRIVQTLA